MVSKMLQFVHVFCLIAVICAAPLDQERKNSKLIEKEPIAAKTSDREYEVVSLEPSELFVPAAVEQKRSSELQDAILNPKDKRRKGQKGNRRRNRKYSIRGSKSRRTSTNKIHQKQQGKSTSREGESEEDESQEDEGKSTSRAGESEEDEAQEDEGKSTSRAGESEEDESQEGEGKSTSRVGEIEEDESQTQTTQQGSDLEEAKVMAAPAAQSLPLAFPNSAAGAASALIAPVTHSAELAGLVTSPPVTETGASLNPTTKSDQTTIKVPGYGALGLVQHYNEWEPPPPAYFF